MPAFSEHSEHNYNSVPIDALYIRSSEPLAVVTMHSVFLSQHNLISIETCSSRCIMWILRVEKNETILVDMELVFLAIK